MAMEKNKVKILNNSVGESYDDVIEKCLNHFLSFCKKTDIVERSNEARRELEKTINRENFDEKSGTIKQIPCVGSSFRIDKSNFEYLGDSREEQYGSFANFIQNQLSLDDRNLPSYSIYLNNDLIENALMSDFDSDDSKRQHQEAVNFLKQVSKCRIFEKLDEKYLLDSYYLFIVSHPVLKTELEVIIQNEGRNFQEKSPYSLLLVSPYNSRNFEKVDSAQEKKDWLQTISDNQRALYIKPGKGESTLKYDFNLTRFVNGPQQSKKTRKRKFSEVEIEEGELTDSQAI